MSKTIQSVRGMHDAPPDEAIAWESLEDKIQAWLKLYGYRNIRFPLLEKTELFVRSIGEVTDIVEKEMYTFVDQLNGESLTLRPEGTASCVRAVLEHNLLYGSTQRLYYSGPMFRHERPQKGRYRQFHQVGVESLGFAGPDMDAEHIIMTNRLWQILGLKNIELHLNTLGNNEERRAYRSNLINYFEKHQSALDEDSKRRLHSNPLRILDSKNPALQEIIEAAPKLSDALGDESVKHFTVLRSILDDMGISYTVNHRLVRGLDYYNLTVFEWITDQLGAQGTICAGGRYDGLVEQLGGKPTPACGFAMGMERILALLSETSFPANIHDEPDIYVAYFGEPAKTYAIKISEFLRTQNLKTITHCGSGNPSAQMKRANDSGARCAAIVGEEEMKNAEISIKRLYQAGQQQRFKLQQSKEIKEYIQNTPKSDS